MVKGLALAAIVVAIALTYWRPLRRVRSALGVDYLFSTGHVFLLLGFLLGLLFGERTVLVTDDLGPIVAFVAGWVGFASGMRFDSRILRPIPARAFVVALLPAFVAASIVGLLGATVLLYLGASSTEAWTAGLVLGAAASSSGPTLVAIVRGRRAGRSSLARPVLRMIEFSAGVDDLLVVLLAVLAFALFRVGPEPIAPAWLVLIGLGGGALLGGVTWLFLGGRAKGDERLLLGLAMLAFIAGFASWLHLSPAAIAAISAIVLVNLPGERMTQLLDVVRRVERPAVVILMTVIGFHSAGHFTWIVLPLVAAMTIIRLLAKQWTGALVAGGIRGAPGLRTSSDWASGLAPQGTLGLVVVLSFFHVWRDDFARTILGAVALASLINEILAPWLLYRLLRRIAGSTANQPSAEGDVV